MKGDFEKPKMLHLDNSISHTGAFRALLSMCEELDEDFEPIILIPKKSSCIPSIEKAGYRYYEIDFKEISRKPLRLLSYLPFLIMNALKIRRIVENEENIACLHGNDLFNLSFLSVKALFGYDIPLVTHVRFLPSSFPRPIYGLWKWLHLRFSDSLVGVSQAVKAGFDNSPKMRVIYDVGHQKEAHPAYAPGIRKDEAFRFLYLANFIPGKGQDLALAAFQELLKSHPQATLTFVGGDMGLKANKAYKKRLMEEVTKKGLENEILFEGFTDDVEGKMKSYHAVLNFSLAESFSMVCWDCLRFGVPMITSDCGGPKELFENGKSGILVPNGHIPSMTRAMRSLVENPQLCKSLSENSKEFVKKIVEENKGKTLQNLIRRLLNRE